MKTKYIVSKMSGVHAGSCLLGNGDTKAEALFDAFGPKPWSEWQKRQARESCVREVTIEEFYRIAFP
jgi:hypothetical protein